MPRLSVVVPCFEVRSFLRECLDSLLTQSFTDFEVIAVDDCSPDGSGAILDEYAARDKRVRVLHLPENVGLGLARNAGMAQARGDYLFFLDSDDTLTPDALAAIADRLAESGDPDVLVFDYARSYWWGGVRRNVLAHLLASTDEVVTVAQLPEILDLMMVAWNKVQRRDFVERHGFAFPPGYYEDTPWTFPVLFSAERIALLDRICVLYRQRRQGSILSTTSRRHFDVHEQYGRVFAFLDSRPELASWRPFLHRKLGEHCLDILGKPNRLPPADRAEFFRRTAELFRAHRPDEESIPPNLRVLYGSWSAYLAGQRVEAVRKRLREVAVPRARRTAAKARLNRPLDPNLVLYSAFSHRGVLGDPAAIHRKAREIAPHLRGVWVVRGGATEVPDDVEHVLPDSRAYRQLAARAAYFVNNTPWPGALVKRPGSTHIHTHQGTPLKYMGADLLTKPGARYGVDVPRMLRQADRWDHSLVANLHSELVWERAYPCHFASARTGSPRNDVLVTALPDTGLEVRRRLGIPAGHTVVLYAPTRRDHVRGGHVDRIDLARFAASLGEGHTLVVRLHPSLAAGPVRGMGLTELHRRGVLVDATDELHVEEVMLASDVLVTDYSALMFDYANLDRPIVVHADDLATYTAARGLYFDVTAEPPGHVTRGQEELAELFASGRWRDEESALLRKEFRARFCAFDDGHAAERVVRTLLLGEGEAERGPAAGG